MHCLVWCGYLNGSYMNYETIKFTPNYLVYFMFLFIIFIHV